MIRPLGKSCPEAQGTLVALDSGPALDIDELREGRALTAQLRGGSSTGLGRCNLEVRDRGLAIDEVLVILGVEHGGLDVGSREPDDGSP